MHPFRKQRNDTIRTVLTSSTKLPYPLMSIVCGYDSEFRICCLTCYDRECLYLLCDSVLSLLTLPYMRDGMVIIGTESPYVDIDGYSMTIGITLNPQCRYMRLQVDDMEFHLSFTEPHNHLSRLCVTSVYEDRHATNLAPSQTLAHLHQHTLEYKPPPKSTTRRTKKQSTPYWPIDSIYGSPRFYTVRVLNPNARGLCANDCGQYYEATGIYSCESPCITLRFCGINCMKRRCLGLIRVCSLCRTSCKATYFNRTVASMFAKG
jgi:hypothetical protein